MPTPDQHLLNELFSKLKGDERKNGHASNAGGGQPGASKLSDDAVLERLFAERKNGGKWKHLYHGGLDARHPSASEAVGALLFKLAFYTGKDAAQMERLIRESGHASAKFDQKRGGSTWISREIAAAIEATTETYKGAREKKGLEPEAREESKVATMLASRIMLGDDIKEGIDPPDELVKDIILAGKVHSIYSAAGMGKTFLVLWVILRVIEQELRVLLFDRENGRRIIGERLEALGADSEALNEHLYYLSDPDLDPETYAELLDAVDPALVVFDSWINFLARDGFDENTSNDIASWAMNYTHPARRRGTAVALLDHVPKEGVSSRGSGRKRDEVDVMWALANPVRFDRDQVGEIVLRREKDREGWLPSVVKFSVGGDGKGGFRCERIDGTIEDDTRDASGLTKKERATLDALETFGDKGAKTSEWQKKASALKVGRRTFFGAKKKLVREAFVLQEKHVFIHPKYKRCKTGANAPLHSVPKGGARGAGGLDPAPSAPPAPQVRGDGEVVRRIQARVAQDCAVPIPTSSRSPFSTLDDNPPMAGGGR